MDTFCPCTNEMLRRGKKKKRISIKENWESSPFQKLFSLKISVEFRKKGKKNQKSRERESLTTFQSVGEGDSYGHPSIFSYTVSNLFPFTYRAKTL